MTEKLEEVDYLRAIACLFVVFIHTTADYIFLDTAGSLTKTAFLFVNRALTFAVPAFIFISGFVLARRYLQRDFSYLLFLKKRLKHIIVPYFGWTLVYYLCFKLTAVKKFLLKLSDASYLIYLSHPLMLMLAQRIIRHEFIPSTTLHFLCTIVFVLGTVLPATFFYRALNLKKAKE
jgi:peptidoglycan/LPS O-acetylase OafA/YrhL